MAQVIVVSRNPGLALAFSPAHLALAVSPDDMSAMSLHEVDALVIDLGDPAPCFQVAKDARDKRPELPVVLVSNDNPAWDAIPVRQLEHTVAVPRASGRAALRAAVDALVNQDQEPPQPEPGRPEPLEPVAPRPADTPRRRGGRAVDGSARLDAMLTAESERDTQDQPAAYAPPDIHTLVAALSARVGDLYSVPEISWVLAGELMDRLAAKAAVVLVPDGPRWRVAGDVGLRALERRLEVGFDHWLVREVVDAQHGVIVEDSDITRGVLAGAPMASYQNLMAVPVPQARAVVMVGRGVRRPFSEEELAIVVGVAKEADALLCAALVNRSLARDLAPLVDLETPRPRRSQSL